MTVNLEDVAYIKIHPGIGLSRLGNSDQHFIGPEAPDIRPNPGGPPSNELVAGSYKDAQYRMKRQAQRFRVYAYDELGKVLGEINGETEGVTSLEWRVHVRNMKSANFAFEGGYLFDPKRLRNPSIQPGRPPIERDQLIIDPGVKTIRGPTSATVELSGTIFGDIDNEGQTLPGALSFSPPQPNTSDPVPVAYTEANVTLGSLQLDSSQRLLFVPGAGESASCTSPAVVISNPSETVSPPNGPDGGTDWLTNQFSYFNVPGWYDDTCGGMIDVTLKLQDGATLSTRDGDQRNGRRGAWIVVAPPKYSPWMYHVVSILDRMIELYPDIDPNRCKPTEFYRDIYPIFKNATHYSWVSEEAFEPHGPGGAGDLISAKNLEILSSPAPEHRKHRELIYALMRRPEKILPPPPPFPAGPPRPAGEGPDYNKPPKNSQMPLLWGSGGKPAQNDELDHNLPNQFLSLTPWQLQRMQDWAEGNFTPGEPEVPKPLESLPLSEQPRAMDFAALQPTIGGGFHPGIEFPYLSLYHDYFEEAFRVRGYIEPGSLAAFMASPWPGDFWSCNTAWWPVQRPEIKAELVRILRTPAPSEVRRTGARDYWFRGYDSSGQQLLPSDTIVDGVGGYDPNEPTGNGYDQMVSVWWQLGMILPVPGLEDGEQLFTEFERDPALDQQDPGSG